jgi:hypothetical protein
VIPLLDLGLPIEPGGGLGGFRVGAHITEYAEVLAARELDGSGDEVVGSWTVVYKFPQVYESSESEFDRLVTHIEGVSRRRKTGHVETIDSDVIPDAPSGPDVIHVSVDVRDGCVVGVSALVGYRGALFEQVRTGMTFGEVLRLEPRVYYDDSDDQVRVRQSPGVTLQFDRSDPTAEELSDLLIVGIDVFDPSKIDGKWLLAR